MEPVAGTGSAASRDTAGPASPGAVVLLADTPGISPGGMESVRAALLRFVDEQPTHQDLVALKTTAGKPGVTGEFAGDRTGLQDGIRKLRFQIGDACSECARMAACAEAVDSSDRT